MPDGDGFSLCRKIRKQFLFPVIMLTAKDEELDKITGLIFGADDYVTKPFRPMEVVARVKAQLRRTTRYNHLQGQKEDLYVKSGMILNVKAHECYVDGNLLNLTPQNLQFYKSYMSIVGKYLVQNNCFTEYGKMSILRKARTPSPHISGICVKK